MQFKCPKTDVNPACLATFRADGIHVDFEFAADTIVGVPCPATNVTLLVPHLAAIHSLVEKVFREHAAAASASEVRPAVPGPGVQLGGPLVLSRGPNGE